MKKLQFLLLICILTFTVSCGQQKRYISYKVKEGETMRDIAKKLDMKTKDLLRLNPDTGRRPEANTVIVIPNPEIKNSTSSSDINFEHNNIGDQEEENNTINETPNDENNITDDTNVDGENIFKQIIYEYETHIVKPKETVYRITKLYDITKDDLIKWNPEFPGIKDNYLSIGQVLKVKSIEKTIIIDRDEVLKTFLTHTVKSKETVYSLTRFYNITKNHLIQLNPEYPGIVNDELNIGQLLKIKPLTEVNANENYTYYKDSIQNDAVINLSVLLPFKAKEYDSITSKDIFDKKNNNSATLANMVTDFYMGLEIAVDSIQKQGVTVNVNVFDTGNRGNNVTSILNENKLDDSDVIIGPFYFDKAEMVTTTVNAPVVFPHFSKKQQSFSGSKLVTSSPNKESYTKYLVSYLKENYKGEEIFVVGDGKEKSNNNINLITNSLQEHDSINNIHVLKPKEGYIKQELFIEKMKPEKYNWIIITSDDYVAIANVLNSMIGLPDDLTIRVFAIEKNKHYTKIENNKLADLNFTYVSSSYTDETSNEAKIFNNKFYQTNNSVPSDYAIKGFDVTYDILMRLASGNNLTNTFKEGVSFRLENKFDYRKKLFGSISNHGLFIVKYNNDLSLSRLK